MVCSIYDDSFNSDWEGFVEILPEWEPWEPEEAEEYLPTGCTFCNNPDLFERPEPFGQQQVCKPCYDQIIGGE